MERYIYINYAYEDYALIQKIIEDIEKTGIKVYHGNGSEEKVAGSLCVIHFWTPAAHTSKSYRKIMNYTLKHELDTMLFHLDGERLTSEIEVQLDLLHTLFKYKYRHLTDLAKNEETAAETHGSEPVKEQQEKTVQPEKAEEAVKQIPEIVEARDAKELKSAIAAPEPKVIRLRTDVAKAQTDVPAKESASEIQGDTSAKVSVPEVQKVKGKQRASEAIVTRERLFEEGMKLLENGTTREDAVNAFRYLRQAASQGHTEAQYQLSVCYDRGIGVRRNITEAAKWCQMAAFGGHAKAQSEIGYCYESGQGVVRNIKEAVSWYEMASAQGNIEAKNNLAYCYQKGRGVHKDVGEAIRLYTEAAAGGHASAQYNLGYCYWYGEGVKTDKNKAIELFKQSADHGNGKAAQMLKILSQHLFMK